MTSILFIFFISDCFSLKVIGVFSSFSYISLLRFSMEAIGVGIFFPDDDFDFDRFNLAVEFLVELLSSMKKIRIFYKFFMT